MLKTRKLPSISFCGLIGAGKTTLAKKLGEYLDMPVFYESVENNIYLEDFYRDPKKFGFALQIFLLKERLVQQQQIAWSGKGSIQDRSLYEDGVFAQVLCESGFLDQRDYETYVDLFQQLNKVMCKPDVLVFLDISPEESMRRIKLRNRPCEKNITLEYLTQLHAAYQRFVGEISRSIPVFRLNWSEFQNIELVASRIMDMFEKMNGVSDLGTFDSVQKDTLPMMEDSKADFITNETNQTYTEHLGYFLH